MIGSCTQRIPSTLSRLYHIRLVQELSKFISRYCFSSLPESTVASSDQGNVGLVFGDTIIPTTSCTLIKSSAMDKNGTSLNARSHEYENEPTLEKIRSAGLLTLSPEIFEKLYLQPQVPVKGELRSIVGNPTPL